MDFRQPYKYDRDALSKKTAFKSVGPTRTQQNFKEECDINNILRKFAGKISDSFAGSGQEIFNASVLIAAVFVIGWTVIWMKTHGLEIVQHAKKISAGVVAGDLPHYSVSVIIMLATLREGSEIVLVS